MDRGEGDRQTGDDGQGIGRHGGQSSQQETIEGPPERDSKSGSGCNVGQKEGGCVYFIRSPDGAFVKIGYTKESVLSRFHQIGHGLPGLHLLGYLPGTRETETWLHVKFRALQENGEWFRLTPEITSFVASIGLIAARPAKQRRKMRKRIHPIYIEEPEPEPEPEPVPIQEFVSVRSERFRTGLKGMRKKKNGAAATLGKMGGKARARALSPQDRQAIARQGGLAKARKSARTAAEEGVSPTSKES